MVERLQSPDLVDPLIGNSTFSLFFRTFGDLMKAADSQQPDLESVHNYLKSTALKSPSKLLEQAKTILSSSSELPNSELLFQMVSEDKAGAAAAKGNDHPPDRRPALNRKRARFSLKPITSQPSLYVNTSLNIDQLEDPEDYFLAHEKLENAEKELRKQRGDALMGLDHNLTETARHRRPGLLGKRASYKHHPLLLHSENDETIASSQETSEVGISSAPKYTSDPETIYQHGAPQQRKIADEEHVDATQEEDSVALKEDRFGRLWDELLSANCMDLDGDRAATFLQERLQFKPISLDKLSLPDLDSVLRNNLEAPVEQLAKPRKALADIHNTIRRADRKASEEHRQLLGVSVCPQASRLEQKCPPASLSFLKRRISQMNSPSDPFLALDGDMSPASVEGIGKRALPPHVVADHLDADNHTPPEVGGKGLSSSGELQSQLVGEEGNIVLRNDLEAPVEQLAKPRKALADIQNTIRRADCKASEEHMQLLGVSVCPQASDLEQKSPPASLSFLKRRISHMNSPSDPFLAVGGDMSPASVEGIGKQALPVHVVADHLDADNHTPSEVGGKGLSSSGELQSQLVGEEGNTAANILDSGKLVAEDLASSLDRLVDEDANGHDTSMDVSLNGSKGDSEDKIEDVLKEAVASEQPELVIEGLTMDTLHCSDSQLDQSGPTAGEYGSVDGHAETRDIPLEQNEEVNELNSRTPPNMHTKPKLHAHQRDKRTKISHRQSLAGAGSLWESGVRRSNRIKIKPLEWWNGERLLYGRIHHSLETVIGLKYASPAKGGGKPTFRVKSFVSDEYKHLVEQAGLH